VYLNDLDFSLEDLVLGATDHWEFVSASHKGKVRSVNEDSCAIWPDQAMAMVADGMGGHAAGDFASQTLAQTLDTGALGTSFASRLNWIEDKIDQAHSEIREYSQSDCEGRTVGSTVVVWLEADPLVAVLWAGDSRLYRVQHPSVPSHPLREHDFECLTTDHSQLNEMLERGLITQEQANGKKGGNIITRAVGARQRVFLDSQIFELFNTDEFLLCSDGLYGALSAQEIRSHMVAPADTQTRAVQLMKSALDAGARDNVSFIIISPKPTLALEAMNG